MYVNDCDVCGGDVSDCVNICELLVSKLYFNSGSQSFSIN